MAQPYKTCPQCNQPCVLSMARCGRCDYSYPVISVPASIHRPPPRYVWIVAFLFVCWIVGSLFDLGETQGSAYSAAKHYVSQNLMAPATADFPGALAASIYKTNGHTYEIKSYVDSQNGFGANLRSDWYCKISYAGRDKWNLRALRIGDTWFLQDEKPVSRWKHIEEDAEDLRQPLSVGMASETVHDMLGNADSTNMVSDTNPEIWNYFTKNNKKLIITFQYGRVSRLDIGPLDEADEAIMRTLQLGGG